MARQRGINGVNGANQNAQHAEPMAKSHDLLKSIPNKYGTHTSLPTIITTITNKITFLVSLS